MFPMFPSIPKAIEHVRAVFQRADSLEVTNRARIHKICEPFLLSDELLKRIMAMLLYEMERGLDKEESHKATIKMLPSYVRSVPNGTESGNFLALDLGGTNFRVLLIRLDGKKVDMSSKIFRVPHNIMVGTAEELFDHIASCMAHFMVDENLQEVKLPLGFTFSFPCSQEGLTKASLINWTKGFKAAGVEGQDVVHLLQEACHRRKDVVIDVVALLNDTTGTLMACAHKDNNCNVGVIVGTGTNACYMEKLERISKISIDDDEGDEIIVNTEWGAFGDNGCLDFIRTFADREIDKNSINPGKQIFEKMISGMYMGELVRLILEKLTAEKLLFNGQDSEELHQSGRFPTKYVSEVESDLSDVDKENQFESTIKIIEDLGIEYASPQDCANVAYVCSVVSTRAAFLCAAGIAVLLNRIKKPFCTVGVDGSVYRFHPTFKDLLTKKIQLLVEPGVKYKVMLSEDGSGVGAALVAAVASRVKEDRIRKLSSRPVSPSPSVESNLVKATETPNIVANHLMP